MKGCMFCRLKIEPDQNVILSNKYCLFLQLEQAQEQGSQLEGAGLIVPRIHRETVFDLTLEEWNATYTTLLEVKKYLDEKYEPKDITSDGIVVKLADNIFFNHIFMLSLDMMMNHSLVKGLDICLRALIIRELILENKF